MYNLELTLQVKTQQNLILLPCCEFWHVNTESRGCGQEDRSSFVSLKIIHADENVHRWQILQKTAFQAKHQMRPSPWRFVKHLDIVLIIVDILGCKSIYSTYKILEYSDCLQAAWKMKAGANFPCNYMIWFASLPVTLEITGHWHVPTLRLFSII